MEGPATNAVRTHLAPVLQRGKPNLSHQTGHERTTRPLPQRQGRDRSAKSTTRTGVMVQGDRAIQKSIRGLGRNLSSLSIDSADQPSVRLLGSCLHVG